MILSDTGCELLVSEEDVVLGYYLDQGKRRSWGIGHLVTATDKLPEHPTRAEVFDQFRKDCKWRVQALSLFLDPLGLNQHQCDALFDFAFNEGIEALQGSTLLHAIRNGERGEPLRHLFAVWCKVDGATAPVLVRRRAKEFALFTLPMPEAPIDAQALIAGLDVAALLDVSPEHDTDPDELRNA